MASKPRPKRLRPTYREHTEEEIRASFQLPQIAIDHLWEVSTQPVDGPTEYARGVAEGERRFAGRLLGYNMPVQPDVKVERNLEENNHNAATR